MAPGPEDLTATAATPGSQFGPYRIEGALGAGGMGQVYRAVDTRLGRQVALKLSADAFTDRFQREARAISALNHPHICTLYDVGPNYLVMELVEGETLAARIKKGKLSMEDTLRYGAQIAAALAEAHAKGIVHRDLKPGNVMIAKTGVKVLDFGLAKSPGDETVTAAQAVLGTPAYMAPEQRAGKECDARTDIYALGLVLREMATGRRDGTEALPPHLAHLVNRCLDGDPGNRWQSARDAQAELEWIAQPRPERPAAIARRHDKVAWAAAALAVLLAAVAAWGWWRGSRTAAPRPLVRIDMEIPPGTPLGASERGGVLALSQDGMRLAITLRDPDGKARVHTRRLDQNLLTPLNGTEGGFFPFFSPDGEWIGFFADRKLKKISVEGGAAVTLCDAPSGRGGNWGEDGNIIAALVNGAVSRIPASGGTPVLVTRLNGREATHRWPQLLPGGEAVMFTSSNLGASFDSANIDVVSLRTGARKTVHQGGFFARYVATSNRGGHLLYLRQSTMYAVPFDLGRLEKTGTPVPILDDVASNRIGGGDLAFAAAPSGPGTFAYIQGKGILETYPISWLDRAGKSGLLHAPGNYVTPRFSPDGRRIAFTLSSGGNSGGQGEDLWVKDLDRDVPTRLTFLNGLNRFPVWTPDGKSIAFVSSDLSAPGIYWVPSDGSGQAQRLIPYSGPGLPYLYSFSPDGKRLAFMEPDPTGVGIFTAPIEGDSTHLRAGKLELFFRTPFLNLYPAFSPDGRWIAYSSDESGTQQVYVRPFPAADGRWQISTAGGTLPLWSRDGRELFFVAPDERVMIVSVTAKPSSFAAGKPEPWPGARLQPRLGNSSSYDVAPDGKRLAALLATDTGNDKSPTHVTFLLNFFDELRRRAPANR